MGNKVLFVNDGHTYKTESGDYYGVHYSEKIKNRYLQLGETVTFATRLRHIKDYEAGGYNKINKNNFNFVEIADFKSIKTYFPNIFKAQKLITRMIREHDVLVTRLPSASGTIAVKAARKLNKPYLVEYVGCTYDSYWNYNWRGKLIAHYKMYEQKRVIKECPYVIYVTKEFLQERYPTNGKSINCSNVELRDINETDLKRRLAKIEAMQEKQPLILGTVAALNVKYKGQDDVIKAVAKLKSKGKHFYYKLVGQGDARYLSEQIEYYDLHDQVEIIGALNHDEVFKFLETIDIYIQPSKQEGLPRALIEAMSKACPALGARTAGIPELLEDDCIFTPSDKNEISTLISKINKEWLKDQANKNFETSKDYEYKVLENKRKDFYHLFMKENKLL